MPGSPSNPKGIPANSSLVFEVEVKNIEDVKAPAPQEQSMQAAPEKKSAPQEQSKQAAPEKK
jgi:hypothetical protein